MTNLVERLRKYRGGDCEYRALMTEAASTIEALSERIAVLEKAIDDIANGRINTDFVISQSPDWHKAFAELQHIAKAVSLTPDLSQ